MDEAVKKVLSRLENQCSRREYCIADIEKKACKALDSDMDAVREVVNSLVKDKYVDDYRYAAAFAREKSSLTGWGAVKIRFALAARHVSSEAIDSALSEIDFDRADARLEKLMTAKWRTLKDDPNGRLKLLKYALGRGYDYDEVSSMAARVMGADGDQAI